LRAPGSSKDSEQRSPEALQSLARSSADDMNRDETTRVL
jgi:hypothetical protein